MQCSILGACGVFAEYLSRYAVALWDAPIMDGSVPTGLLGESVLEARVRMSTGFLIFSFFFRCVTVARINEESWCA